MFDYQRVVIVVNLRVPPFFHEPVGHTEDKKTAQPRLEEADKTQGVDQLLATWTFWFSIDKTQK